MKVGETAADAALHDVCPRSAVNSPPLFSGLRGRFATRFIRGLAGFYPRLPVTGHELRRPEGRRVSGMPPRNLPLSSD